MQPDRRYVLKPITRPEDFQTAEDQTVSGLVEYWGPDADAFGAWKDNELIAACWFWYGERYRKQRRVWPLRDGEAKLIQINVARGDQRCGVATTLIQYGSARMFAKGFHKLYAKVWHSNLASIRAFEKAGWKYEAFLIDVKPRLIKRHLRWVLRTN